MNRIRHAYLELVPELEPYLVTSRYDDEPGIRQTAMATRDPMSRLQPFVALPGLVALLDSVVAGAAVGSAGVGLGLGLAGSLALGCVGFLASAVAFFAWATRAIRREMARWETRFPSTPESATR